MISSKEIFRRKKLEIKIIGRTSVHIEEAQKKKYILFGSANDAKNKTLVIEVLIRIVLLVESRKALTVH